MAQHPPLARMLQLVDAAVHVHGFLIGGEGSVEIGFAHIGAEPIDGFEGGGCVDRERVGTDAHVGAVLLVGAVEGEVARATVCVVGQVDVGYGGEFGAGVFCEGVQGEAVNDDGGDLDVIRFECRSAEWVHT